MPRKRPPKPECNYTIEDIRVIVAILSELETDSAHPLNEVEMALAAKDLPSVDVNQKLADLEFVLNSKNAVGELLVQRSPGKPALLTMAGQVIGQKLTDLLAIWAQIQEETGKRRRVNIALSNSLFGTLLPQLLADKTLRTQFPGLEIKVLDGEPHENIRRVVRGEVHFAIGTAWDRTPLNWDFVPLRDWKRVLLFRRDHHLSRRLRAMPLSVLWEVLRDETLIIPTRSVMPELDQFRRSPRAAGQVVKVSQAYHRMQCVTAGVGLAVSHVPDDSQIPPDVDMVDLTQDLGVTRVGVYRAKSKGTINPLPDHASALLELAIKLLSQRLSVAVVPDGVAQTLL